MRRVELWLAAVVAATASPKVGGPTVSELTAGVIHYFT